MSQAVGGDAVEGSVPLPPAATAGRADAATYERRGQSIRSDLLELLPAEWSFAGKRVLDFGCGTGRVLRHFLREAQIAEFHGCDVDREAIEWLDRHLSPPLHLLRNNEIPPLSRPDASFDLIWALSVFTHLTDNWSPWLLDLHRMLKEDGLLIASYLGRGTHETLARRTETIAPGPWHEEQIGMNVLRHGESRDRGGPIVLHSPWWINEHWGRAFDIVTLWEAGFGWPEARGFGHGAVLLRKRPARLTPVQLERIDAGEPREISALRHNIRQLHWEAEVFRERTYRFQDAEAERRRLSDELQRERSEHRATEDALRAELEREREELRAAERRHEAALERQRDKLEADLEREREELRAAERRHEAALEREREKLEAELEREREELRAAERRHEAALEREREKLEADLEREREELRADLEREREKLEADLEREREELRADHDREREKLAAALEREREELRAAERALRAELERERNELSSLERRLQVEREEQRRQVNAALVKYERSLARRATRPLRRMRRLVRRKWPFS